jgi:hypothetical protein
VPRSWVALFTMRGWPPARVPRSSICAAPDVLERSTFLKHALGPIREGGALPKVQRGLDSVHRQARDGTGCASVVVKGRECEGECECEAETQSKRLPLSGMPWPCRLEEKTIGQADGSTKADATMACSFPSAAGLLDALRNVVRQPIEAATGPWSDGPTLLVPSNRPMGISARTSEPGSSNLPRARLVCSHPDCPRTNARPRVHIGTEACPL